jgi:hypothetical protein
MDVLPRQAPVALQIEGKPSYSDYIKQQLQNEHMTELWAVALGQLRVGQENLALLKIEQPLS